MILFDENNSDNYLIEADMSVSPSIIGAYETLMWIEEQNRLFMEECATLDVTEVLESTEVFNEGVGEFIKNGLTKLKDFVVAVCNKIIGFFKGVINFIKDLFSKDSSSSSSKSSSETKSDNVKALPMKDKDRLGLPMKDKDRLGLPMKDKDRLGLPMKDFPIDISDKPLYEIDTNWFNTMVDESIIQLSKMSKYLDLDNESKVEMDMREKMEEITAVTAKMKEINNGDALLEMLKDNNAVKVHKTFTKELYDKYKDNKNSSRFIEEINKNIKAIEKFKKKILAELDEIKKEKLDRIEPERRQAGLKVIVKVKAAITEVCNGLTKIAGLVIREYESNIRYARSLAS